MLPCQYLCTGWHEKETITYFDRHAIEGVYFRDGDLTERFGELAAIRGKKFPAILFPSGDEFDVWATDDPEKGASVHFFGELDLKYENSRDEAHEDAGKIAEVFDYRLDRVEDNQLEVWSMDEGVVITYDNDERQIVNAEHFKIPEFEQSQSQSRLLPPELWEALPPLYANEQEGLQARVLVKFFTPDSFWSWYASEFDGKDTFFGLAVGFEAELGYFTLSELESVRGRMGLPVERDLYFEPASLRELLDYHRRTLSHTPSPARSEHKEKDSLNLVQHYARFSWHSWTGQEAWHDVKLYKSGERLIAVITEPIDRFGQFVNPGQSVTNGIEEIARQLRERGHEPDILIEHYPAHGLVSQSRVKLFREGKVPKLYPESEEFSLVTLHQNDPEPQWKHLARAEVDALLGGPFPEWHQERGHVLGEDDFSEAESETEPEPHNDNAPYGETEHMRFVPEPMNEQIILRRAPDGGVQTNVPWRVRHHSPGGYEWGYGGSGPADLALNILENILLEMNYKGTLSQRMFDGRYSFQLAWTLHQEFKEKFIAPLPRGEDATISTAEVLAWLHLHLSAGEGEEDE